MPHSSSNLPISLPEEDSQSVIPVVDADQPPEFLQRRGSPVTRVPHEILAYILGFYVAGLGEVTPDDVRAQGPGTCLALVCKLWKAVVDSYPQLWTFIHFCFPDSREDRKNDVLRIKPMFDLHLKRSGALPISLTFIDHRMYDAATRYLILFLVDRLRSHARRWRSISLHLSVDYIPLLFTFTQCDLSSLEHLCISGDVVRRTGIANYSSQPSLNLETATNLKSFTYSGPRRPLQAIHLQWENLSEISLEFALNNGWSNTLAQRFSNISRCHNVTTCSLGIGGVELEGSEAVTLPRLETLRVRRVSPHAHANRAIDLLVLPQLQTLEIDASFLVGWNERWHDRNFSDLLARSGCGRTLRRLSIQDVDFANDELVRCLALSPALTSLRFVPCPRSQDIRDVVRGLDVSYVQETQTLEVGRGQGQGRERERERGVPARSSAPLVPLLCRITLASSELEYLDPMMAMFRSRTGLSARAAGVAELQRTEVVFFDMWHCTDVDRVPTTGGRLERVERFRADMTKWASENEGGNGRGGEERLEASVVVNSPYLPGYVDAR